jgi:hypothetical protein
MTVLRHHMREAIVRVGGGRGFVVEHNQTRLVITAAHCLPLTDDNGYLKLTPGHVTHEKICKKLLGPLGGEPTVWCDCLFVNPIADIAVLGRPEHPDLCEQTRAYDRLVDEVRRPLTITAPKMRRYNNSGKAAAYLLSLDGEWCKCTVRRSNLNLGIENQGMVASGMSGSPIVSTDGKAIGLVSTDDENPVLRDNLPTWFFL